LVRRLLEEDLHNAQEPLVRDGYKALLDFMEIEGKVYLHQPERKITREDILRAVRDGGVVIAYVTAEQYYGVKEDWGHALTLVPFNGGFKVLDGFARKGYLDPDLRDVWDGALEKAKKFEWNNLVRMIEVKAGNTHAVDKH
jgi:hypothetical protein